MLLVPGSSASPTEEADTWWLALGSGSRGEWRGLSSEEVRSSSISAFKVGARGELQELSVRKKELSERESMWASWDGTGWVSTCGYSGHGSPLAMVQKAS